MIYRDSDNKKPREVKDILVFITSFLAHLERMQKEKDYRLVKVYGVEDGGTFKKFSQKKDITKDLYYNVYCGGVVGIIHILPMKEYILFIVDIPYRFGMVGSTYDDEPVMFMVKDFTLTITLLRIFVFHSMDQRYSRAQALRSHYHGIENLAY